MDKTQRGEFKLHPASPVCIPIINARVGGKIILVGNNIFRFDQCCNTMYGEFLAIIKIDISTVRTIVILKLDHCSQFKACGRIR